MTQDRLNYLFPRGQVSSFLYTEAAWCKYYSLAYVYGWAAEMHYHQICNTESRE